MNLNLIRPKKETEDLILSTTENFETLVEQTHKKAEETLDSKIIKPRETFHFKPPTTIKDDWMLGLTSLEVYISIFNITEENSKIQLYIFLHEKIGGVSYEKVKDEIERDLDISDITATDLQDEITAPIIIEEHSEQKTKRMKDDGYVRILAILVSFMFQDIESFLRKEIDFVADDIRLVLDEYVWSLISYDL